MIKVIVISIILGLCVDTTAQTGIIKFDITITDTIKPYYLNVYLQKGKTFGPTATVISNGVYTIKDVEEGLYKIEISSFQSRARKLFIDSVIITRDSTINLVIIYPGLCRFVYDKKAKPQCPFNHSDNIVKIVYGLPRKKTLARAKKGLLYLGGCNVSDCDPKYYCMIHKKEI
ncbi:MAG: hypothetical protein NTW29_07220 [Bacteroidetes bacterium]|nr:hypothetical protein [Bacteroidota bacterium]